MCIRDRICKAGYVVIVGNHYNGLPELRAGALDKSQHLGAGLAVKVTGWLIGQHNSRFGNQRDVYKRQIYLHARSISSVPIV